MHRKIAQSTIRAFSSANSQTKKAFEQQIVAEATELVEIFLKLSAHDKHFNPAHELTVAAANVICALCFGKRYGHDDVEFRALLHRVDKFGQTVGAGSLVDVMPWLQSFPNPVRTMFRNFKMLNQDFYGFVQHKVEEHRETFDPEVTRDMSDAVISRIKSANDNRLTRDYAEGTVSDLIGAVGRDRLPSVDDRSNLAYLDAFIYETMRFTSFVPMTIPHSTTSEVTIEGLRIPKDTVVFINQWSINHDPLMWKDPHIFDPSRFLDEKGSLDKDLTNNVMIFSAGKRRCIGNQIAKVEIFLFFAILLHQCSFEKLASEDLSLNGTYGLTLKPLDYKITAKLRGELLINQ
ncbi:Cytochrome P450 1B1 [Nibea albiflora]|uniref:Cytochrome P450 1B1 n=1 Tax=Nibea albiflora TaxID=240163 RepID=A0ACB7FGQ9_NIBAL|nr:Cytochrome P450 1B1 [Nibea albiflora]